MPPTHPSAVIATLPGTRAHIPHVGLEAANWSVLAKNTSAATAPGASAGN
ncbi:hypothetical protein [Streptomyces platensis]